MSKAIFFAALLASAEARFNQEGIPGAAVAALSNRGTAGAAGTLSGQVPGVLLAAASACAKLELADKIVAELGTTDDVIAAARGVAGAEQNFNPFAVSVPKLCDDASLPTTQELRGVIPLVDPSVTGSAVQNANAQKSRTTPFAADGMSVAQISIAQGFSNFTLGDTGTAATGGAGAGNNAGNTDTNTNTGNNTGNTDTNTNTGNNCNGNANTNTGNTNTNTGNAGNNTGNADSNTGGNSGALDFGTCDPSIEFALGRTGRKANEGTFLPVDPAILKGQSDALNPSIIMNRVCDQLNSRTCNANQAAIDQCLSAKAQVEAVGTRDASTATLFNQLVKA